MGTGPTRLDTGLGSLLQGTLLEQALGLDGLQRCPPTSTVLGVAERRPYMCQEGPCRSQARRKWRAQERERGQLHGDVDSTKCGDEDAPSKGVGTLKFGLWGHCRRVTGMAPSTEVGTSGSVELVTALSMSTGFIWVKSLHRSLYGAMVWSCDQNSVGNTPMFQLWLNNACTVSRPFLPLTQPRQRAGWGCTRPWEGTQLGQLTPNDQGDIPYLMMSAQQKNCELLLLTDWLGISRLVVSNVAFCIACSLGFVLFCFPY